MPKYNLDIRDLINASGFSYWMIADRLGISDSTFSRWLRKELPNGKKKEIINVIEQMKSELQIKQAVTDSVL